MQTIIREKRAEKRRFTGTNRFQQPNGQRAAHPKKFPPPEFQLATI